MRVGEAGAIASDVPYRVMCLWPCVLQVHLCARCGAQPHARAAGGAMKSELMAKACRECAFVIARRNPSKPFFSPNVFFHPHRDNAWYAPIAYRRPPQAPGACTPRDAARCDASADVGWWVGGRWDICGGTPARDARARAAACTRFGRAGGAGIDLWTMDASLLCTFFPLEGPSTAAGRRGCERAREIGRGRRSGKGPCSWRERHAGRSERRWGAGGAGLRWASGALRSSAAQRTPRMATPCSRVQVANAWFRVNRGRGVGAHVAA